MAFGIKDSLFGWTKVLVATKSYRETKEEMDEMRHLRAFIRWLLGNFAEQLNESEKDAAAFMVQQRKK